MRCRLLPLLVWAVVSSGCGSTSTSTDVAPSPVRCNASGAPERSSFPPAGGTANLVVTAPRECSWAVTSDAPWIGLSGAQGSGDGQVRYSVSRNSAATLRRGRMTLGAHTYEITQQAAACQINLSRRSFEVDAGAHTLDVNVDATAGCSWNARSTADWMAIAEGSQGSGDGRVRFRVSAHTGPAPRSGGLEVSGIRVDVRQLGSAPKCSYSVNPANATSGPEGGEERFAVQADDTCSWKPVSDQPWLTIVSGAVGSGPGEVRYLVARNAGAATRTGHVSVEGTLFTLQQEACRFTLDPTSASVDARSSVRTVQVRTSDVCQWTARSNASWIVVTSGQSGEGDGQVEYTVLANTTSSSRTGSITIGGQRFTVTQTSGFTIDGRAQDVDGSCPNKRFTVRRQRVRTTSATLYQGGSCQDLREDTPVRVSGVIGADGVMTALEIEL